MSVTGEIRKIIANKLINKGVFGKDASKPLAIVMYHGIDKVENTKYNPRFFSKHNFELQIASFKKHFNILSHTDFINKKFDQRRPNMLITFDDGYANNARYALPVLDKYNAHAYFFVTGVGSLERKVLWADATDIVAVHGKPGSKVVINNSEFILSDGKFSNNELRIDLKKYIKESKAGGYDEKGKLVDQLISVFDFTQDDKLADYWQLMTDEEIHLVSQSKNITVGSHGFYHNNLGSMPTADAVNEVVQSKKYLEQIIQKEVSSIAFPDGSYTEPLNDVLFEKGITCQFVVDYKFKDEEKRDFVFDRFGLYPGMGNQNEILHRVLKN